MKTTILILALVSAVGCATTAADPGSANVIVTTNPNVVASCKLLGQEEVAADDDDMLASLKNAVGRLGGDVGFIEHSGERPAAWNVKTGYFHSTKSKTLISIYLCGAVGEKKS